MPPKSAKKDVDDWRKVIEDAVLDEDTWHLKVIFLESAGGEEDRQYLSKFEAFAADEKRFVIRCIGRSETIFMINQLGGEKKTKDDNLRVFEAGQAFLKEKQEIPSDILALIIKHLMLKMKEEYIFIQRQKLEVMEGLRQESLTMIGRDEVRGDVSVKPHEPKVTSVSAKSKGKGSEPLTALPQPVEGKKYNTVLRERGEEWRDRIYVDDFPVDGPNIYIAVSGFIDPNLPIELIKIGIPITAFVQIRINPKITSSVYTTTKRGQSETDMKAEKCLRFWEDLQDLRINKDTADFFKNTAFIIFNPPYWESEDLPSSPDKIYDELCYLMYDVQDLWRQHLHYIDNMEVKHIPEEQIDERFYRYYFKNIDDLPLESVTIYSLLDSILRTACTENFDEKSSSSLVTSTMVRNQKTQKTQKKKNITDTDDIQKAKALVKSIFTSLCKTDADKKQYRTTYGDEYENYKDPILIQYGDFIKYRTFHLNNINLDNIVGELLFGMPLHKLWLLQEPISAAEEVKISFHVNLLLSCFERQDIETAELKRLLHILACRKLYNNRSSLKKSSFKSTTLSEFKKVYLKRSILAEPLFKNTSLRDHYSTRTPSFPSMTKIQSNLSHESPIEEEEQQNKSEIFPINSLFYCPDISELLSAAEIANNQPINHMIDEFEYFEDFTGTCAYQVLLNAFNKFNCVDYKYCEVTDTIICMFFNSHDKDGIFSEEWRVHICTPVCLQDFFDYVLEEQYDWIQSEEKIYDASILLKRQSLAKDMVDLFGAVSCIDDTNVEVDLLMEGSLKHQVIIEQEEANKLEAQELSEKGTPSTKDGKYSVSSSTITDSKPKRHTISKQFSFVSSPEEEPIKPYLGYDLGDNRRVEVFGKDVVFFSRDRTRVSCLYTLIIPYNVEYLALNFVPGEGNNKFWVHRVINNDLASPEIQERCEGFRVNTKDKVLINFKKQFYQVPIPTTQVSFAKLASKFDVKTPKTASEKKEPKSATEKKETKSATEKKEPKTATDKKEKKTEKKERVSRVSRVSENEIPQFETKHFYSFCITWPNGLITESVHDENSPDVAHIKQYYVEPPPHSDEDMRCISLNGEVVIFKTSGDIKVLCPDGRSILITKYKKELILPVPEFSFDTKNDKGKRKDKPKGKDKGKKIDSAPAPEIPLKYELRINQFEIIESNGLREKWVEDESYIIEKLTVTTATDYCIGEIFSRRTDGTHILLNKDGVHIVTFPDHTRIVTFYEIEEEEIFPEWTEEEKEFFDMLDLCDAKSKETSQHSYQSTSTASSTSKNIVEEESTTIKRTDGYISVQIIFTVEHANYTTVSVNKGSGKITIDSPNYTSLTIDKNNNYDLDLGSDTSAHFDGEDLNIKYEACPECKSYTKCDIKITNETENLGNPQLYWAKLKDSFCKKIGVDYEGNISLLDELCAEDLLMPGEENANPEDTVESRDDTKVDWKSETSITSHGKCRDMYQAKNVKFIVLERSLNCSELVHRAVLEQYKKECHWKPWCYIKQAETFGDHRSLHSVWMPISVTETEKWLMNSKMCDKPSNLTFKDLKKDCGKGFYHWMRPYEQFRPKPMKVDPVHNHKQPRAFVLRTLEHQWGKEGQEELKGAKELLLALLRYRRCIESESETLLHIPIIDERPCFERGVDRAVQALGEKIYQDLKERLEEDVQLRTKLTITTEPPLPPEEMTIEPEMEEEVVEVEPEKLLEEERIAQVKQVEDATKRAQVREKYWRRRAVEVEEEEFYLCLLRKTTVPPYFSNLLGGAIWWELDHLADEAITTSQRRKMKCMCESDAGPSSAAGSSKEPHM